MEEDREPLLPKHQVPSIIPKEGIDGIDGNRNVEHLSGHSYEAIEPPPMIIGSRTILSSPTVIDNINLQEDCPTERVPSDYSGYAWLSVLFCCIPLSIAAIYSSDKVLKCIKRGELRRAHMYSTNAKKLSALAIIYGALMIIVAITIYFVVAASEHKL